MKKITIAGAAVAAVAGPLVALGLSTGMASADAGDKGYGSQPGFEQATGNTAGAGAGSFGAFGTFGDVKHDQGHPTATDPRGANGPQTGLNNSSLPVGNRQSNK